MPRSFYVSSDPDGNNDLKGRDFIRAATVGKALKGHDFSLVARVGKALKGRGFSRAAGVVKTTGL